MFFNTGNTAVAQWMRPPDTSYLLDLIRPDLLLLRIIAKGSFIIQCFIHIELISLTFLIMLIRSYFME